MDGIKVSDAAKMAATRKAAGHINHLVNLAEALTRLRAGVESGELPLSDEIADEALALVEEYDQAMADLDKTFALMELFKATEGDDDEE